MPLPLTVSCFSKIQIGFTFLVPAQPGSPRKRTVKRVCVCVKTLFRWSLVLFIIRDLRNSVKTLHCWSWHAEQNPSVLNWWCWLTQVVLHCDCKTGVVVVLCIYWSLVDYIKQSVQYVYQAIALEQNHRWPRSLVCWFTLTLPSLHFKFKGMWARGRYRISPPHFLAECCKRQLNQGSFVCCILGCLLFLICIEFVCLYFPVLFCLSVSVKWLTVKTASEMTYIVSSGALNSTPTN